MLRLSFGALLSPGNFYNINISVLQRKSSSCSCQSTERTEIQLVCHSVILSVAILAVLIGTTAMGASSASGGRYAEIMPVCCYGVHGVLWRPSCAAMASSSFPCYGVQLLWRPSQSFPHCLKTFVLCPSDPQVVICQDPAAEAKAAAEARAAAEAAAEARAAAEAKACPTQKHTSALTHAHHILLLTQLPASRGLLHCKRNLPSPISSSHTRP